MMDADELELDNIEKHVLSVKEEELRAAKKKRKVANKERQKLQEKMKLKMVLKGWYLPTTVSKSVHLHDLNKKNN